MKKQKIPYWVSWCLLLLNMVMYYIPKTIINMSFITANPFLMFCPLRSRILIGSGGSCCLFYKHYQLPNVYNKESVLFDASFNNFFFKRYIKRHWSRYSMKLTICFGFMHSIELIYIWNDAHITFFVYLILF